MRILRVAQKIYPDTKGGGQYHVHAMSRDQAAMGHDVTVVTTKQDEALPDTEETDGYEIIRLPKGVTVAGNDISPAVARYLWNHANRYDIVHAHSHLYFSTNIAAIVRRLGNVPLAITNHGLYSQSAPEWVFGHYLRTLGRWTFNQADAVFCYTDTDKTRLQELGVRTQIEVVPNGIDTERFRSKGPKSELIDASGPVVLFVGRLVEGKRPGIAVDAFFEILEEHPDAEMYLCGDGPLRGDLEAQVQELGISRSVTFLGHVSYDEMPKIYRAVDVLVLPSRAEGLPRTVLEALASGIQVVSSDLPQLSELAGDNLIRVNIQDGTNLAQGVISFIRKPASTPQQMVSHSWDKTVTQTTAVFEGLINQT